MMLGAFAASTTECPAVTQRKPWIFLASGPLLPGLHRPGLQKSSAQTTVSHGSFPLLHRWQREKSPGEMRFLRRSAPPSVRRPRRDSAEPAWCARSLRAVVPSIGTNRLVQKIFGFLCRTKDGRRRLGECTLSVGRMELFGRTISHDLRGET